MTTTQQPATVRYVCPYCDRPQRVYTLPLPRGGEMLVLARHDDLGPGDCRGSDTVARGE